MKAPRKTGEPAEPRCWWCKIKTEAETGYRGSAPDLALPPGAGVVVCTPACPERPEGATVWATRRISK